MPLDACEPSVLAPRRVQARLDVRPYGSESAAFCATCPIATAKGEVMAANLTQGDLVLTRDRGFQPVMTVTNRSEVPSGRSTRMVRLPLRDENTAPLLLSADHGVLYRCAAAEFFFSEGEVLVPAAAFVDAGHARWSAGVAYRKPVQITLAEHALIFARGVWVETTFNPSLTGETKGRSVRTRVSRGEARLLM